jgi:NAD-dependent deacetylase
MPKPSGDRVPLAATDCDGVGTIAVVSIEQVRSLLAGARNIAVLTGAGISAESGIPTFRGPGGLWRNFRPEQLATPEAFAADPKLSWEWYDWRRSVVAKTQPNAGHRALVTLEARSPRFTLITQNVDGLHERAGSRNVLRIHGSIWHTRCTRCGQEVEDLRVPMPELPPLCGCGGMLRPGVVWFGEGLPSDVWDNAQQAVEESDLLLVVGTSAVVYPAASLVPLAARAGANVVEVNPDETVVSRSVTHSLRGPSGEILPQLIE